MCSNFSFRDHNRVRWIKIRKREQNLCCCRIEVIASGNCRLQLPFGNMNSIKLLSFWSSLPTCPPLLYKHTHTTRSLTCLRRINWYTLWNALHSPSLNWRRVQNRRKIMVTNLSCSLDRSPLDDATHKSTIKIYFISLWRFCYCLSCLLIATLLGASVIRRTFSDDSLLEHWVCKSDGNQLSI